MEAAIEDSVEHVIGTNGQYRSFLDAAPLLMCVFDAQLRGVYFNQNWMSFTGHRQGDLLGDQWVSDIHPQDRDRCFAGMRKALKDGERFELEFRLRRFDGEFCCLSISGAPQFSREGRLQHYIGIAADVSARKVAEDALRNSELHRHAVFGSSVGHVAVIDCAGRIIGVNNNWLRFARQQSGRLRSVGCGVNYLEVCKSAMEADDPNAKSAYEGIIAVLNGSLPEFIMEYRCPTPNEELWFEMVVHPLCRQEGGGIITHLNITKRYRAEVQAQTLLHELAHVSRVAVLGELTASVTHELSQPLMAIQTHAQAAKRILAGKSAAHADIEEIVSDILADNSRAERILQQLRALLKKGRVGLKPLKLNNLIRDVADLLEDEAARRKVKVTLHLDTALPQILGERIQLQQIVLNLMVNAFDAMRGNRSGGRELIIETAAATGGRVLLLVQDNGPGIPQDKLDRIFEPFFTTKPDGLGMGLAICRSIVELHGGRISVANNPEKGVTFRIVLPVLGKGNL
ncbi:MAG TPA: ATP-binding protein [Verrucomicrobiae bacterium]|nr:ATP-binding protein [Verrucomicrobiae bacterium]